MTDAGNLYFSYGSNMDVDQMAFRQLGVEMSRGAVLEGYKLAFDFPARARWLGGAADIIEEPGSTVEGVLHTLTDDVSIMDPWEGGYERVAVEVSVLPTLEQERAWTYVVIDRGEPMTPSHIYVDQMLKGAREAGLSSAYIDQLERHWKDGRKELGDHVEMVRVLAHTNRPLSLEDLADSLELSIDGTVSVLSDLGRWGWVHSFNEPPVFRLVEGKERASPWILR
ncbi:MAG: gamma-glutamylcyclotransferase [Thermoplasmata archaeon]|nr:MAG: gamma-glutamylcyclotransferase [Thermoplasmata archaeon]